MLNTIMYIFTETGIIIDLIFAIGIGTVLAMILHDDKVKNLTLDNDDEVCYNNSVPK